MRKINFMLLLTVLAGCASAPISQGGKAEIEFARDEMIRIRWDPQRTNERDMRSKAIAFCGGRDVEVMDPATPAGAAGNLQARTWRCDSFPGTGAGM